MLIDWVSFRFPLVNFSRDQVNHLRSISDRIVRFCPKTGEVKYETCAWDSIRSDSHQVSFQVGSTDLRVQGSPARVFGDGDAVFGSGYSAELDIGGCVLAMAKYASKALNIVLPLDLSNYAVTRIDVTNNLLLDSLAEVRDALSILRDCQGGRYRVSQQAGDTVYWSHRSALRSGKAYAKGPHLNYLTRKLREYTGRIYAVEDIKLAGRLLRLELKLGHEFFRRNDWQLMTSDELKRQWSDYFMRMIGTSEITRDDDVKNRIFESAPTEGAARAAYGCWSIIGKEGWERAREMYTKRTWYRHLKIIRNAGLGDADISTGKVAPMKIIQAREISSWEELRAVNA
jgi:II/X family phage/plasmid replication protein